jgi:hypothetical protein
MINSMSQWLLKTPQVQQLESHDLAHNVTSAIVCSSTRHQFLSLVSFVLLTQFTLEWTVNSQSYVAVPFFCVSSMLYSRLPFILCLCLFLICLSSRIHFPVSAILKPSLGDLQILHGCTVFTQWEASKILPNICAEYQLLRLMYKLSTKPCLRFANPPDSCWHCCYASRISGIPCSRYWTAGWLLIHFNWGWQ